MGLKSQIEATWHGFHRQFLMVPQVLTFAPGRINLIGDHTDYSGGLALPAPIDRYITVAANVMPAIPGGQLRVYAVEYDELWEWKGGDELPEDLWKRFVGGAYTLWREQFGRDTGFEIYLHGTIPQGAGLSSSAALEIALLKAMMAATSTSLLPLDLCKLAQQVEHRFLGLESGLLDQMAVVFGKKDQLLQIDFQSLEMDYLPVPELEAVWVVVDSAVERSLAGSGYQQRVEEMRQALAELKAQRLPVNHWREVDSQHIPRLPDPLGRRVRHYSTENNRVRDFSEALSQGDLHLAGALLNASHASLRDDYGSSCAECDHLQFHAANIDGCYGSRIMGGGFGGCTLNLVAKDRVDYFKAVLLPRYGGDWGIQARAWAVELAHGAGVWPIV